MPKPIIEPPPGRLRRLCWTTFYDPRAKRFMVVNDVLAFLTLLSIAVIILETVPAFGLLRPVFNGIEYVSVAVFTLEYLGRIIANRRPLRYLLSFFGLVDLLAIAPSYLHLGNLTALKSARMLRILRFLRMLRFAKIARLRLDRLRDQDLENNAALFAINLEIYVSATFTAVVMLGSLMYVFEQNHEGFSTIPMSMLWVFENILGGSISTHTPQTTAGLIVGLLARFAGLVLLGMLIHIVGVVANRVLLGAGPKTKRR